MATFLAVLLIILLTATFGALFFSLVAVWFYRDDYDWPWWVPLVANVVSVLLLAGLITFMISLGIVSDDNSKHCSTGTEYVSDTYYNPATKQTVTEWFCVVA